MNYKVFLPVILFTVTFFLLGTAYSNPHLVPQKGHPSEGLGIAFAVSNNGKYLASDDGNIVVLWEIDSSKQIRTFFNYDRGWHCDKLIFSENDDKLICAGKMESNTFVIWSTATGAILYSYDEGKGVKEVLSKQSQGQSQDKPIAVSNNGKYMLTVGKEMPYRAYLDYYHKMGKYPHNPGVAYIINIESEEIITTLKGNFTFVRKGAVSSDGQFAVTPLGRSAFAIWSSVDGLLYFEKTLSEIEDLELSDDDKYVLITTDNGIEIFDLESEFFLEDIPIDRDEFEVRFSPNGKYVILDNYDSLVVYDTVTGTVVKELSSEDTESDLSIVNFSEDSQKLLIPYKKSVAEELHLKLDETNNALLIIPTQGVPYVIGTDGNRNPLYFATSDQLITNFPHDSDPNMAIRFDANGISWKLSLGSIGEKVINSNSIYDSGFEIWDLNLARREWSNIESIRVTPDMNDIPSNISSIFLKENLLFTGNSDGSILPGT